MVFLQHEEIDYERWDASVACSRCPLVYAKSWYLDAVSPGWAGLVADDYSWVFPLPEKRKYGLRVLLQPPYCQQLGLFSSADEQHVLPAIFRVLARRYRVLRYTFNESNAATFFPRRATTIEKRTYVLDLHADYSELRRNFSENCRRNIKKSSAGGFTLSEAVGVDEMVDLVRRSPTAPAKELYYTALRRVSVAALSRAEACISGVYNERNVLIASVLWLQSGGRHIYLSAASDAEGRERRAMFFLVDEYIKSHAGTSVLLDFEGSSLLGVERFYKGFGAEKRLFHHVRQYSLW